MKIAIVDIAAHLRRKPDAVRADLERLSVFIGTDWRGLPAVSEAEAADFVAGRLQERAEHAERQRLHAAEVKRWTQGRERAIREAYEAAAEPLRRVHGDPKAAAAGSAAAREAGRRYELDNPRPSKYGSPKAVKHIFLTDEEALTR